MKEIVLRSPSVTNIKLVAVERKGITLSVPEEGKCDRSFILSQLFQQRFPRLNLLL
ncbi:hypothetical protein [Allocoleopsis franciscana]|uniref:hypothetical protein n=1 Tax=Allocoleopsis franciscana TaxID=2886352 RepID=UPI001C11AFC2|nr:hypothetical protein [Allocoleopsis franciscana]